MSFTERGSFEVEGFAELERKLLALPKAVGVKALTAGLRAGAAPMVRGAKIFVPRRSGALAASIGTWSRRGKYGDHISSVFVGPKRKSKKAVALYQNYYGKNKTRMAFSRKVIEKDRDSIRHGHLIEFGTIKMPAKPYLLPAFDANRSAAVDRFAAKVRAYIEKVARS